MGQETTMKINPFLVGGLCALIVLSGCTSEDDEDGTQSNRSGGTTNQPCGVYYVGGNWTGTYAEESDKDFCTETETKTIFLEQAGCNISIPQFNAEGQIDPETGHFNWSGQYPEDGGTSTAMGDAQISTHKFVGTGTFSWVKDSFTCQGTASYTFYQGDTLPDGTRPTTNDDIGGNSGSSTNDDSDGNSGSSSSQSSTPIQACGVYYIGGDWSGRVDSSSDATSDTLCSSSRPDERYTFVQPQNNNECQFAIFKFGEEIGYGSLDASDGAMKWNAQYDEDGAIRTEWGQLHINGEKILGTATFHWRLTTAVTPYCTGKMGFDLNREL
jgi:hypothetical protein